VRRDKIKTAKKSLVEKLPLLSPVLREAILQVRDVCAEAEALKLYRSHLPMLEALV